MTTKISKHNIEQYEKMIESKYRLQKLKMITDKYYIFTSEDFEELFKIHKEKRKELIKSWKNETKG